MKTIHKLPEPPAAFVEKKQRILQQLSIPTDEYTDASPKGSIDVGIRDLIDEINTLDGFVTTSSCAGRVSVFVEGVKTAAGFGTPGEGVGEDRVENTEDSTARPATIAGVGGKGGGGNWLLVSHDPVPFEAGKDDPLVVCGLITDDDQNPCSHESGAGCRLIHFKFEPMILHVLTASLEHAQLLLRCGLQAGFRESGAINLTAVAPGEPVVPMVAIRSMGLLLESLVGEQSGDRRHCTVTPEYLVRLLNISNQRFQENSKRIGRFRSAVLEATSSKVTKKDGSEWEDAGARRARKREEGLRRRQELLRQQQAESTEVPPREDGLFVDSPFEANLT